MKHEEGKVLHTAFSVVLVINAHIFWAQTNKGHLLSQLTQRALCREKPFYYTTVHRVTEHL